jgi:hypothetical protein
MSPITSPRKPPNNAAGSNADTNHAAPPAAAPVSRPRTPAEVRLPKKPRTNMATTKAAASATPKSPPLPAPVGWLATGSGSGSPSTSFTSCPVASTIPPA